MLPEWVSLLPSWLVVGMAMGAVASLFVTGVFVVGDRLFPTVTADGPRVDGGRRRHVEIRDYLRAIDERFLEDHTVHGETVAFYLPARDVAITFDPQAYYRLERAGTRSVLCEYEMPAKHLARRLPFEVSPPRRSISDVADPVAAAFDSLDLPASADETAVKRAYRTKVKSAHPDQGGSREEFRRLREAYDVALDHAE